MGEVKIEIAGRLYRMACDDGEEERLKRLGAAFDATIAQLKESFGEIGDRRLVVMAGLMAADERATLAARVAELEAENGTLKQALAAAEATLHGEDDLAERVETIATRIDTLAHLLNETVREDGGG